MMSANRTLKRSSIIAAGAVLALALATPTAAEARQGSVQQRFEAGKYEEAVQAASENPGDPVTTFVGGQAALRMEQPDRAREMFQRLASSDDRTWQLIGRSALALLDGNVDEAVSLGSQAVESDGNNAYAHYQLGLALSKQGDMVRAAEAFNRATEIDGNFAYAHYYAGIAYQRLRNVGKAGEHFNRFLELAPDAPERSAVVAILRTMRG